MERAPITADPPGLRADAARNRDTLLAAATRVFAASTTEPSLREIAREAGVGVATLYRRFPSRAALVDAVYQDQVLRLTAAADELLQRLPPAHAMRRWMDLFGDWLATKHGMAGTLMALIDAGEIPQAHTRQVLLDAISAILTSGAATGDIRDDIDAEDVAAALLGIIGVSGDRHRERTARLLDLVMDGLRPRADETAG